jgi:hypothetical protein
MKKASAIDLLGRSLLTLAVAGLLVLGAVVPHDADAEASGVPPWQEVAQTTTHPDVPEHIESPATKTHEGCTACLVQLQSQTLLGISQLALADLPRGAACSVATSRTPIRVAPRLGPARAPPSRLLPA